VKVLKSSIREQLTLNVLWFSLNVQAAALVPVVVPTQILLFVSAGQVGDVEQATFLGWLTTAASIVSLFMPPIIGQLSDKTPGPFGRRRPYIVLGGLVLLLGTPFLVAANNIAIFLLGLSLLHIGRNILQPAYQSLVPDKVPENARGLASGYVGGMTILGNVVSLGLAAWLLGSITQQSYSKSVIRFNAGIFYIVSAVVMLIGMLITVVGVKETPFVPEKHARPRLTTRFLQWFEENWMEPWRSYNFTVVFLTRSAIMLGLALFMTFIEYYFARVQHITNFVQVTAVVAVLALGGGVVSGVLFGILSDRLRRRAPVVTGATLCMSLASLAFVLFPNNFIYLLWPLGVLFGLGFGAYFSVDWALSIDALPSIQQTGKDLGLWNASTTIPAVIAPLLGSLIINIASNVGQIELGYRAIFAVATFFLVVAAICVLFVREDRKTAEMKRDK
jgi:MFS family permease